MTVFAKVVEQGSFARAAERLEISTSACSRVVADLEAHLDTRLLQRTTRRLSLTESGQGFYERCVQLLADLNDAELAAAESAARPRGTVRLTTSINFGIRHVSPAIGDFVALSIAVAQVLMTVGVKEMSWRLLMVLSFMLFSQVACVGAGLGLYALSVANSPVTALLAATIWGTGCCYMWPTMLAAASERFPRGGALLMGLMGTGGTLSIFFVLPQMGKLFDSTKIQVAGGKAAFEALKGDKLNEVLTYASQYSFRVVAILPAILLVVFGAIWLADRARGGYKPVKIAPSDPAQQ